MAAHLLGRRLTTVSVVGEASACGHTAFILSPGMVSELEPDVLAAPRARPLPHVKAVGRLLDYQLAVICLAGPIAGYLGSGMESASTYGAGADVDRALEIATCHGWTDAESEDFVYEVGLRAAALLRAHWPTVEALADVLLRRRELSGRLATAVLLAVGCRGHRALYLKGHDRDESQ